ncbi:uncharacterized protein A1O9_02795 [Exophiala aquamarina CBS 119918]|uniref:Uncharacterized protein n=1 Tax=Exophiala aquamarina CBS 119918 TaxID=1182545 RepID=A0A072Q011_9EURO|nr:uncharacterized protein A1O9_02795 [Exophiala aquamarina CBS 119918]KEF61230.1 hypothetical protein A1O9_02795 [Exophiala aquamarina CBS 119918]
MNRYRTMPGLGPQKATASTLCQKCLKKDMILLLLSFHYSYECKASAQERPYISRPSRTQQLLNPKLVPKLSNDSPNHLLNSKGVADKQLAQAEASRNGESARNFENRGRSRSPRQGSRSRSISSDSVSTISTNKSRSRSPADVHDRGSQFLTSGDVSRSRLTTTPPHGHGKRKHRSMSSSPSRSPRRMAHGSHRKTRRHRTISPIDRGRPSSMRRGSHRSRTNTPSMDIEEITKHRRSMDSGQGYNDENGAYDRRHTRRESPGLRERYGSGNTTARPREQRKERSLSPYSKRLALTQAMNM